MKHSKDIATLEEIVEQLEALNLGGLFKDLVTYAMYRMKGESIVDAEKLVGDVFEKTVTGVRNWNKAYTFKHFLFGSVKSLVSQYNDQFGQKVMDFNYEFEIEELSVPGKSNSTDLEDLKKLLTQKLKEHVPPPDEIEEMIFECWLDEITRPREIAEFWGLDITEIYKAKKRLERKLGPIRELLNSRTNE
ncbi:MAG: hypothetical protein R2824_24180 [Saprospiraceae bacterium]|nr:hypothetical protein [Lewinella sp.]